MDATLPRIADLDPDRLQESRELTVDLLEDYAPGLYQGPGTAYDLITSLFAGLYEGSREVMQRAHAARSPYALAQQASPDRDDVVAAASIYGLTVSDGTPAAGVITVEVNAFTPLAISSGDVFELRGIRYRTPVSYNVRTSADLVLTDRDLLLRPLGPGAWAFDVSVRAAVPGPDGLVRSGEELAIVAPIATATRATAAGDFIGGKAPDTAATILQSCLDGPAARLGGHRPGIIAAVRDRFPEVLAAAVFGMGDPEMRRDKDGSPSGIGSGGRADLYVRTSTVPIRVRARLTAEAALLRGGNLIWQVVVPREIAPGFWRVDRIARPSDASSTGFPLYSDSRMLSLPAAAPHPDMTGAQFAYTPYQSAIIQFSEGNPDPATAIGAEEEFDVDLEAAPSLGLIQQYLSDPANAPAFGDILVRATVPLYLSPEIEILTANPGAVDEDAIRRACVDAVGALGIGGEIGSGILAGAAAATLAGGDQVIDAPLSGTILYPDGQRWAVYAEHLIIAPDDPARGVTPRTVAPYLAAADISISYRIRR